MKIQYKFATETISIDVPDDWGEILIDLDRQEYDLAAQVLGLAQFDEGVFLERVKGIDALPDKTLVFHFKDGSTAERHWEYISRAKSWTPEMKEIARQRALAQRRGEKWQEP